MALAEELAGEKGVYTTHLRSEFEPILDALDEAFRIGRHGKVPVVVSHHKCAGAKNWGRTKETLAFFDQMRQHQKLAAMSTLTRPALQRWISNKSPTNSIL